jgi:eukaryotic-like serine/threonine-protein kinase
VLYEITTGRLPFDATTTGLIFQAILDSDPPPVSRFDPNIPRKLEDIINKALEKDRELRYQSAQKMRSELQRLKRDIESGQQPRWESSVRVPTAEESPTQDAIAQPAQAAGSVSASSAAAVQKLVEVSLQQKKRSVWKIVIPSLTAVTVLIAGVPYYRQQTVKPLTDKDTVVLADFTNSTGRPRVRWHAEDRAERVPEPVPVPECARRQQSCCDVEPDDTAA